MPFDKDALTFEQLDAILRYEPETGKLFWKTKTARKIVAGIEAGSNKAIRKNAAGTPVAYRYIRVFGKSMPAQRVAWVLYHGEWPIGRVMFHDNDPLNTKIDNLFISNSLTTVHDHDSAKGRSDYAREHREKFPLDWKDSHLRSRFGISFVEYGRMLVAQGGKCAICGCEETQTRGGVVKALAVDHDHVTGKVRGLLCGHCNQALGKVKEDRKILLAMISYLDKHAGVSHETPKLVWSTPTAEEIKT